MNPKLTPDRLRRRAVVYVRQSSPGQVIHHQESQRRQYGLVDRARELGFQDVGAIDDDLGRTTSGLVERPGFQRLVSAVCTGEVGAVFCIEASRLARNGRYWHHLIELWGMVGAVLVDFDGVYDPNLVNDRLPPPSASTKQGTAPELSPGSASDLELTFDGHAVEAANRTHPDRGGRGGCG